MGKIFGICDNPVTTIESSLRVLDSVPRPKVSVIPSVKPVNKKDLFVTAKRKEVSNPFIKMRNGIGKLMSHFKKVK